MFELYCNWVQYVKSDYFIVKWNEKNKQFNYTITNFKFDYGPISNNFFKNINTQ